MSPTLSYTQFIPPWIYQWHEDSPLWIFCAGKLITESEKIHIHKSLTFFVQNWTSHGQPIQGSFDIIENAMILIAADSQCYKLSGCGIDKVVYYIQELGRELNINFLDRFIIPYYKNEKIHFTTYHDKDTIKDALFLITISILLHN